MYEGLNILNSIQKCFPQWLNEFNEIAAGQTAQAELLKNAAAAVNLVITNQRISSADKDTLRAFEEFLHIKYSEDRLEEDRVNLIRSHFIGNGRFGVNEIREIVSIFTGSPCNVRYADGVIDVEIARDIGDRFILDDCVMILNKRKPAHLALNTIISSPFEVRVYAGAAVSEYRQEVVV